MEKFVTIINQGAHVAHQYTAQDGTQKVYHTMGFVLSDGIDEFYARTVMHRMQGYIKQRPFTDKNGAERHENQIYITKLI